MKSMGIDISTRTGLAVCGDMQDTKWITFGDKRGFERLHLIAQGVKSCLSDWQPDIIVIEGYGYANRFTLVPLVELGTVVRKVLYDAGYKWVDVAPTALKKFTTGKGNAKKADMAVHAKERWGFASPHDDVVDAFALAQWGLHKHKINGVD